METIILRGKSASKANLLLELAKEFNFTAKKLTEEEMEEIGLAISVKDGIQSGILDEKEAREFLGQLRNE